MEVRAEEAAEGAREGARLLGPGAGAMGPEVGAPRMGLGGDGLGVPRAAGHGDSFALLKDECQGLRLGLRGLASVEPDLTRLQLCGQVLKLVTSS